MAKVYVKRGESLDAALDRFKQQVKNDKIMSDHAAGAAFESSGSKRRKKQAASRARQHKTAQWIERCDQKSGRN